MTKRGKEEAAGVEVAGDADGHGEEPSAKRAKTDAGGETGEAASPCNAREIPAAVSTAATPGRIPSSVPGTPASRATKEEDSAWAVLELSRAHISIVQIPDCASGIRLGENGPTHVCGRNEKADTVLRAALISGRHCTFSRSNVLLSGGTLTVALTDTSTNGTYVEEKLIGKGNTVHVKSGEIIRFGKLNKGKPVIEFKIQVLKGGNGFQKAAGGHGGTRTDGASVAMMRKLKKEKDAAYEKLSVERNSNADLRRQLLEMSSVKGTAMTKHQDTINEKTRELKVARERIAQLEADTKRQDETFETLKSTHDLTMEDMSKEHGLKIAKLVAESVASAVDVKEKEEQIARQKKQIATLQDEMKEVVTSSNERVEIYRKLADEMQSQCEHAQQKFLEATERANKQKIELVTVQQELQSSSEQLLKTKAELSNCEEKLEKMMQAKKSMATELGQHTLARQESERQLEEQVIKTASMQELADLHRHCATTWAENTKGLIPVLRGIIQTIQSTYEECHSGSNFDRDPDEEDGTPLRNATPSVDATSQGSGGLEGGVANDDGSTQVE